MEIEKQKIKVTPMEWINMEFGKQGEFKIKPYLSLDNKEELAEIYIRHIFEKNEGEYSYILNEIRAEYSIVTGITNLCTDLSINFSDGSAGADALIGSGLWDVIKKQIINYDDFRKELSDILNHIKEDNILERSIGTTFDKVADAVMELIEQFSHADISDEGMKKAAETFKSSLETLQMESPISSSSSIIPEKKPRKSRTSKKELL
jgi:hypothetical protein